MGKTYLSFCHDYHKLANDAFTTIRGASAAKQYKEGQVVDIIRTEAANSQGRGRVLFRAQIVGIEVKPLADIPIDVLQRDAAYGRYCPKSHADFMGLINSLRVYSKMQDASEPVAVIQLFKA